MSNDAVSLFLALLAVVGIVFLLATVVVAVVARTVGLGPGLLALRDGVDDVALPFAWAVATTCTLGSLYMSEVRHFTPCAMCWYQRICMYPLVVLLGIAALRRDRRVWIYALPLAIIGACISTYHYLHERFPETVTSACDLNASCATVWVWELHFLSIPGMAWVGFVLIATLLLLARSSDRRLTTATLGEPPSSDPVMTDTTTTAPMTTSDSDPEEVPA